MEPTSTTLVLFGISGDLSRRKILPSLIHLYKKNLLPKNFHILGLSRKDITLGEILGTLSESFDQDTLEGFKNLCIIMKLDVNDIAEFTKLNNRLSNEGGGLKVFYLSVPPETLPDLVRSLGTTITCGNIRILFEKPFGTDYDSASRLIDLTKEYFRDEDVYHIDHYLAKQIVKDLIDWKSSEEAQELINNNQIKKIEILSLESLSVEGRANFYEGVGALRDLIQSHLLEILAIVIQRSQEMRYDALGRLTVVDSQSMRGQYVGYRKEVRNEASTTETLASITLQSSDPLWHEVPFTLTTGKALHSKLLAINITTSDGIISIGHDKEVIDFGEIFDYEKILSDAFRGDQTIFLGSEEILATWKLIEPVLDKWSRSQEDLFLYEKSSTLDDIMKIYGNNKN